MSYGDSQWLVLSPWPATRAGLATYYHACLPVVHSMHVYFLPTELSCQSETLLVVVFYYNKQLSAVVKHNKFKNKNSLFSENIFIFFNLFFIFLMAGFNSLRSNVQSKHYMLLT